MPGSNLVSKWCALKVGYHGMSRRRRGAVISSVVIESWEYPVLSRFSLMSSIFSVSGSVVEVDNLRSGYTVLRKKDLRKVAQLGKLVFDLSECAIFCHSCLMICFGVEVLDDAVLPTSVA